MTSARPKVFGIGLNKTGTTTLGRCLETLGYRHMGCSLELTRAAVAGDLEPIFLVADEYECFEDWPWPLIYPALDARYPGSKFILTVRNDAQTWFGSLRKHAERTGPTEFRKLAYGWEIPHDHRDEHIERYEGHNRGAREYFRARADDFLEVCWERGDGWKELCAFLGKKVPDTEFPHANPSPRIHRESLGRTLKMRVRALARALGLLAR